MSPLPASKTPLIVGLLLFFVGAFARIAHLYWHLDWARGIAQIAVGSILLTFAYIVSQSPITSRDNIPKYYLLVFMRVVIVLMLLSIAVLLWGEGVWTYL